MKKKLHRARVSSYDHVLSRARREIGAKVLHVREIFGLAEDTIKGLVYRGGNFTAKAAGIVSEHTGIFIPTLLENNPAKPLLAVNGRPFTKAFYEKYQSERLNRQQQSGKHAGTRALMWQRALAVKIARVLILAHDAGQADKAFLKLRDAISGIESDTLRTFENKAAARNALQQWDVETQAEFSNREIAPNRLEAWSIIWKRFERQIAGIEHRKPAARK